MNKYKRNNNIGASLFQYIIIIILISLGAFVAYLLLGEQIKKALLGLNSNYGSMNDVIKYNSSYPTKAGDLGGTPNNPKMQCLNNSCVIDFGSYILKGVPEDTGLVSAAKRGGEETLNYAKLLNQLADQLESSDPGTADLLRKLAKEAERMGTAEILADKTLEALDNVQQSLVEMGGNAYDNVATKLSTIDPNNLSDSDYYTMMGAAGYLNACGLLTDDTKLQDMTIAILAIKADAPNLNADQIKFINDLKTSPDQVNAIISANIANLSETEKAILVKENSIIYNVATNSLDAVTNYVNSSQDALLDAGGKFNSTLQEVKASIPGEMSSTLAFIASQIQTTGDSIEQTSKTVDTKTSITLEIPADSGLETKVAAGLIEEASK